MNINTYDISFGVRIAKFRELNEHSRGDLLRSFAEYIKKEGLRHDFLVADVMIKTKENDEHL